MLTMPSGIRHKLVVKQVHKQGSHVTPFVAPPVYSGFFRSFNVLESPWPPGRVRYKRLHFAGASHVTCGYACHARFDQLHHMRLNLVAVHACPTKNLFPKQGRFTKIYHLFRNKFLSGQHALLTKHKLLKVSQ